MEFLQEIANPAISAGSPDASSLMLRSKTGKLVISMHVGVGNPNRYWFWDLVEAMIDCVRR